MLRHEHIMQPFMLLPLSYTMKKDKGNKGLLDGKRFESLEREKRCWLQNLSRKKALQLEEKMLSSRLVLEWRDDFPRDNPVCLAMALRRRPTP